MLLDDTGTQGFDYYSDDDLLDRLDHLERMNTMMSAYRFTLLHEVEVRKIAALDGHSSTGVWLTNRHRLPKGKANALVDRFTPSLAQSSAQLRNVAEACTNTGD